MSITSYEVITIRGDNITADLLIWRRYRCKTVGMVEAMLDLNPHLAKIHQNGPFIPVGTQLRIPIDLSVLAGAPRPKETVKLWGTAKGYTL